MAISITLVTPVNGATNVPSGSVFDCHIHFTGGAAGAYRVYIGGVLAESWGPDNLPETEAGWINGGDIVCNDNVNLVSGTQYSWYVKLRQYDTENWYQSDTWSFTAVGPPSKATTPAPANAVTTVTLDQATLDWVDGGGATSYDVYYGTVSGSLTLVSSSQAGLSFTISGITNGSPFNYLITRYWRIDSINSYGTTTGDEWSFTTIRLDAPTPIYWYSTGSYYYQLLIKADGVLGTPPPTGVENTDYVILASTYLPNFIRTNRILVAAANSKIWYET